jgi:uncharacterized membrane protein (UPF0127 family)
MKGLVGRSTTDFKAGSGLWIAPSEGIHTIGMAFPIDAVYLDAGSCVVRIYQGLAPFRIGAISLRTRSVLELPAGTLARTQTAVGDVLEFHPNPWGEV